MGGGGKGGSSGAQTQLALMQMVQSQQQLDLMREQMTKQEAYLAKMTEQTVPTPTMDTAEMAAPPNAAVATPDTAADSATGQGGGATKAIGRLSQILTGNQGSSGVLAGVDPNLQRKRLLGA